MRGGTPAGRIAATFASSMLGVVTAFGPGCAQVAPTCDAVCPVARPAFEACLETWGLQYGEGVGYTDADDYDEWCDTWVSGQRLLANTHDEAAAVERLDERCGRITSSLEAGNCLDYWGLWDEP